MTSVGIVGCGYVFDHYMATFPFHSELKIVGVTDIDPARLAVVGNFYGLRTFASLAELIEDARPDIILNLTSIGSHDQVIREALLADRHVYSEKPITMSLAATKALFALAADRGLRLSAAPCNLFSDTMQTMWKAMEDGAIGLPRLVYAEFDDNPIYLMAPESWRSRSGAPWPHVHEYESGCTIEHAGYHLTWLAALFGPAKSITAFSQVVAPDKTTVEMHPADTPDFSVACIQFAGGVVARLTCSIVAPADHRIRIIGNEGELSTDTYRHYQSPVYLERFSKLSLNARKARSVRTNPYLGRLLGVGGRRLKLLTHAKSGATRGGGSGVARSPTKRLVDAVKRREVGAQDKVLGVAETARALRNGQAPALSPEFLIHVTEMTLAIQNAGPNASTYRMTSTFAPGSVRPLPSTSAGAARLRPTDERGLVARWLDRVIDRLHSH